MTPTASRAHLLVPFVLSCLFASASRAAEDETSTRLDEFEQHIRPLLEEYCYSCHGEKKQKADFAVHDIDGLITGGKDIVRWGKDSRNGFPRRHAPRRRAPTKPAATGSIAGRGWPPN